MLQPLGRNSRHVAAAAVVAAVVATALVVWGRVEGRHAANTQNDAIAAIENAVGQPLENKNLSAYRVDSGLNCLFYRSGGRLWGLELCFDGAGRLVEAADRRQDTTRYWSVAYEPKLARIHVDPVALQRLLKKIGAV